MSKIPEIYRAGFVESQKEISEIMDEDTKKIVGAILDILEEREMSVARAKNILKLCEELIEWCTVFKSI